MESIDIIHTIPQDSNQASNILICYEYTQQIPNNFKAMPPMDFAYLACLEQQPDDVLMQLIKVTSWNRTVLKIQSHNPQQLSSLKRSMHNKFKYVLYQSIPMSNNTNNQAIYNAEDYNNENKDDSKYEQKESMSITTTNNGNASLYSNSNRDIDYAADEESGNDEEPSKNQTKRHKKPLKQIKKERQIRQHKKDVVNNNKQHINTHSNKKMENINCQSKSEAPHRSPNDSEREQKASEPQYAPTNIAPPPNTSNSDTDHIYNQIDQHLIINNPSPPKPNFNFQYNKPNNQQQKPIPKPNPESKVENKNINMDRPSLPIFDFDAGIQYKNINSSDNLSSIDYYDNDPKFANEQHLSSPPPIHNNIEFGKKFKYHKTRSQYRDNRNQYNRNNNQHNRNHNQYNRNNNQYNRNNKYNNVNTQRQPPPPPPQPYKHTQQNYNKYSDDRSNRKSMNQQNINRQQKSNERTGPPVLQDLFGSTQVHDDYLQFHSDTRHVYAEKLKSSSKREKNPKNYFLLPILMKLGYKIGEKIGKYDYKFHSDAGANGKLKGRDSNKYYGVDYKTDDEKDESKNESVEQKEKDPSSVLNEVMQSMGHILHRDYRWKEVYDARFQGQFTFEFVFKGQPKARGEGNNKKNAKKVCSKKALDVLKMDTQFRDIIDRKEAGIGGSGKKDRAPMGYEYPIGSYLPRNRKYKYEIMQYNPQKLDVIELRRFEGYSENIQTHRIDIYIDRGYIRDHARENPNVEEMYAKEWAKFQSERNIPKHSHQYLDENGKFIKQFSDMKEKELWKAIWKFYKPNFGNRNFKQNVKDDGNKSAHSYGHNNVGQQFKNDDVRSASNNSNSNRSNSNRSQYNNKSWKHYVIYDFDGTIYAERLYKILKRQQDQKKYMNELSDFKIRENGWRLERIDPLKNHFNVLKMYKNCGLCVVLHTFHSREHLNKLFGVININIDDIFDIIICSKHKIIDEVWQICKDGSYTKMEMIEVFRKEYNVLNYNNILCVDDDPNIKADIKSCEVFISKKRCGISKNEMIVIEKRIKNKFGYNNQQFNYNNNNDNGQYQSYNNNTRMQYGNNYNNNNENNNNNNNNMNMGYQQQYGRPNYNEHQSNSSYNSNNNNNNNNNTGVGMKKENCTACGRSFDIQKMTPYESIWLCSECFYANKDTNRMSIGRPNQYNNSYK